MKIKDVIEEILLTRTPFLRAATQSYHKIYFTELKREIGEFELKDFNRRAYKIWIAAFRTRKTNRKTFFDYTKYINMIFRYAHDEDHCDFLRTFPYIDQKTGKKGRVYVESELIQMWDHIETVDLELRFCMAYEMYMRKEEVGKLEFDIHVDFEKRCIRLRPEDVKTGSRTGEGRIVPMSEMAFYLLSHMRKKHPNRKYVFENRKGTGPVKSHRKSWRRLKRKANIVGRSRWHDFRGTGFTHSLEKGGNLDKVSAVSGCSPRTMSSVYVQPRVEHLREATAILSISRIA